jgi:hypothetical protein
MSIYGSNYAYGASPLYKDDGAVAVVNPCNDGTTLPPTTALDIIKRALRLLGVLATNETPDAPEVADCLQVLNWMIDDWSNQKLMTYYISNEIYPVIVSGKQSYTIGPDATQDINTSLPERISSIFVRDNNIGIDYQVSLIPNDRWQGIILKSMGTTYPMFAHYVRSYPYGTLEFWPIPSMSFSLGISQWHQFKKFINPSDIVCLPPGYKQALGYNLAVEMSAEYGKMPIDPLIDRKASELKANLKRINFEPVLMSIDSALTVPRPFNIFMGF